METTTHNREAPGRATPADEAALLARLGAGDREQPLLELHGLYARRIYAIGLRLLDDGSAAEELVQEVFVRMWQRAATYDPAKGPAGAWIMMIARSAAIDMHRRAQSRPRAAEHRGGSDPLDGLTVEDGIDAMLSGIEVRAAIEALPGAHRQVIEMAYDEQLTQTEIAERLSIPLGTVKTRTYHALRGLKTQLEERRLL